MKRYEKESLFKNFLVFFSLLIFLLILLFLELYHSKIKEYKQNIYKDMEVCSYTLECPQYKIDFVPKDEAMLQISYDDDGLYSYFRVPKSKKFNIKLAYSKINFQKDKKEIMFHLLVYFLLITFLIFMVALFFTFYSLKPIRKALQLNDEFIKDILHDFNTPMTSLILNISMLDEEKKKDPTIRRIEKGVDNILLLQNNLKAFLSLSASENMLVDIAELAHDRLAFIENLYPKIKFNYIKKSELTRISNYDLLVRILDNLLSNAAKYNRKDGKVDLIVSKNRIEILDTGKGIEDVKKVLERYYIEQDRGLGIGLHIVNKLNKELGIVMKINSQLNRGTEIILDFEKLKRE